MKKTIKALKLSIVFLLFISSFIACDKDFNIIDSDVLGKGNANFSTSIDTISISAYNKTLNAIQINNLASNLLGVFDDPAYGLTTASIVTQVTPTTFSPNFGVTPVIDSVVISIPYYSTTTGVDGDGNTVYALDSLYGNPDADIKLSIYQNKYFLSDSPPDITAHGVQNYYSNAGSGKNSALNGSSTINFDDHLGELLLEKEFKPSAVAIITTTGTGDDEVKTRSVPALRVVLENKTFWKTTIIDKQDSLQLSNPNQFKNYFRGLYFKAEEAVVDDGNLFLINLASSNANITIYYTSGETDARTQSTYALNFSGNRLNTFINDYNKVTFPVPNKDLGDEKLYLKGAEGSMAIVDLFGNEDANSNNTPDELEDFLKDYRQTDDKGDFIMDNTTGNFVLKRLINEAHLEIYEDQDIELGTYDADFHKYDRIYAYDTKNNAPTLDYQIDPTENAQNAFSSKIISLSQRDTITGQYKIRLTEHLNNILLRDSIYNTQVGLVLSTNVNYTTNAQILNSTDNVTAIPASALITPRGTILHGSNPNEQNKSKKIRLKIFYTEPN